MKNLSIGWLIAAAAVLFVVIFLVLAVELSPVAAYQEPTSTPNTSYLTPPAGPTSGAMFPTVAAPDFSCPSGVPEGYGDIVPDPAWEAACYQCLPTPTSYPTMGPDTELPLACDTGDLLCYQVDEDTIYFTGLQGHDAITEGAFTTRVDSDIYLYYKYAGYFVRDALTGEEYDNIVTQGIGQIGPVGSSAYTPAGVESYVVSGVPASWPSGLTVINNVADDGNWVQDFACTRIYVSLTPFSLPAFTCPINQGQSNNPVIPTATPSYGAELLFDRAFWSAGSGGGTSVSRDAFVSVPVDSSSDNAGTLSNDVYISLDDLWRANQGQGAPIRQLALEVDNTSGGVVNMFWRLQYEGSGDWGTDDEFEVTAPGLGVFFTSSGGSGSGVNQGSTVIGIGGSWTGAFDLRQVNIGYCDTVGGCETRGKLFLHITTGIASSSVVTPMPVTPIPGDDSQAPVTGSYCAAVVPLDDTPNVDFDIITEGPSECTTIPGFSLAALVPDFISPIVSWAVFPASTFCYHTVDLETGYILNVTINFSIFFIGVIALWFVRKITQK